MNLPFLHKKRRSTPPLLIAGSFLFTIAVGTVLLKLPAATTVPITWTDAMFTAASATTVTGLSVFDIASTLTLFGELVLLALIQIGGVGLMAFAVAVLILLGRKVGMKNRLFLQESFSQQSIGGTVKFLRSIFAFVFITEGIAFVLLSIVWVPKFGWTHGLYYSLFHVVSAFNNAGFSLFPDNLIGFAGDWPVTLIISSLFIIGGLGFTVVLDLLTVRRPRSWSLHTKMMVYGTLLMNAATMVIWFLLEFQNAKTIGGMPVGDQLLTSYFQAVTPRTAGFNMVPIGEMTDSSMLLTLVLMFIGGGSASTASGIKLTTFLVIVLSTIAYFRGTSEPHLFNRTIKTEIIVRSLAIAAISSMVVFLAVFLLTVTEPFGFMPLMMETVSAFGTVGLSVGITGDLSPAGEWIISLVMFLGRIGPLTLFFLLIRQKKETFRYTYDRVHTG
ncbi:ktr system potassium uptake protein B [Sporosarcina sp. NCCP-2716]|uniref:TrkH family potassium uptake protein n=1 Tax=Sporosarcina sp. NCCP-2716 TaxID=2943679 RepID=UPI00203EDE53|nr:TrkH family potassium uptake protein [Sporosarcina sp. NCCP-2716]GKV68551.1 ktr system potassium uptake protein B [Sporosarcina sp. NCCP-2716]